MPNKKYTFSLPPEVDDIIDALPKKEQSEYVAKALLKFHEENKRLKTLDAIDLLKPMTWDTDKDAVCLVKEARKIRAKYLTHNE